MRRKMIRGVLLLGVVCGLLTGCAHPQLMDPGLSTDRVETELGEPHAKVKLDDGGERWVYSMQPFGQEVWWLVFDKNHHLIERKEVLSREYMALIKPGESTQKDVWNLFGQCAEKYTFSLIDQTAWMYRFMDEGFFHMACWVQFDVRGVVTEVGFTTDPWHERDGHWLFSL